MGINLESYIDLNRFYKKDNINFIEGGNEVSYPKEGNNSSFLIEENSWWFSNRNNYIVSFVKRYTPNSLFWDIGGGNGFVSKGLQQNGINTILVEPGIDGAINASKRGINEIFCSTLEQLDVHPSTIESAGLFDVLEHIENPNAFLNEIHKSMKTDGKLFITVPAYNFLWSSDDDYAGHYKRYTIKTLKKTLSESRFEMVNGTYFYSILIIPIYFFRTLKQKLLKLKPEDVGKIEKGVGEHNNSGLIVKLMSSIWNLELWLIKNNIYIPFGASCLVVARKIN
jgi:hypothetical protein